MNDNLFASQQEQFTEYDFSQVTGERTRMKENEFSLNFNSRIHSVSYQIAFSQSLSHKLEDARLTKLLIRKDNITGAVYLLFNRERGISLRWNDTRKKNFRVANKELCLFIMREFGVKNDGTYRFELTENKAQQKEVFYTAQILGLINKQ